MSILRIKKYVAYGPTKIVEVRKAAIFERFIFERVINNSNPKLSRELKKISEQGRNLSMTVPIEVEKNDLKALYEYNVQALKIIDSYNSSEKSLNFLKTVYKINGIKTIQSFKDRYETSLIGYNSRWMYLNAGANAKSYQISFENTQLN